MARWGFFGAFVVALQPKCVKRNICAECVNIAFCWCHYVFLCPHRKTLDGMIEKSCFGMFTHTRYVDAFTLQSETDKKQTRDANCKFIQVR